MNNGTSIQVHQWMADTPHIDNLSLMELTLPGTHNAGCDWEASYPLIPGANWLACQDVPFYSQLNRGARALDVRLIYDAKASGFNKFRFQHSNYRSTRHLGDLVRDINGFLERSSDEFIVLDFHELADGSTKFNHAEFKQLMLQHLGERMIPPDHRRLTLGELKDISRRQRVLVAASVPWTVDQGTFDRQIDHRWIGQSQVSTAELQRFITEVMSNPPGTWDMWSLSATCYTLGGPQRILDELDDWFDPARTDWAKKCNIINFDFIKNSNIVKFCLEVNRQKAMDKSALERNRQGR
ncbi:phospholipase [Pseudomonas sp. SWRI81]|uniref:phospholipase n=1 Tax=Pseudomonas sp. SWRI81 TaxID=2745505 RepID=UPI0016488AF7|nr:phospholipase [Pseudomonas sp. SWRI81]MBC3268905.1 phospholipase [Pseudomonas sp. SWRI81]